MNPSSQGHAVHDDGARRPFFHHPLSSHLTARLATSTLRHTTLLTAAVLVAACGGSGGGGGGTTAGVGNDAIARTLTTLGVNIQQTPRQTDSGIPVDDTYSPFGRTWKLATTHELFVVGNELDAVGEAPLSLLDVQNGSAMYSETAAQTPWDDASGDRTRKALAADFDGDGLEEAVVVYQNGIETRVRTISPSPSGPMVQDVQIAARTNVTHLTAEAGDIDGDGKSDLVIGTVIDRSMGDVAVWTCRNGFFEQTGPSHTFDRVTANGSLTFRIALGDIDRDSRDEFVVVANSVLQPGGTARYKVFDDEREGFAELASDAVAATDQDSQLVSCVVADVAIGDIDGDSAGEIVFGGITQFPTGQGCLPAPYFGFVVEDLARGLIERTGYSFRTIWTGCNSPERPDVLFAFVDTFDVDGDGLDEIHVNEHVFDDFASAQPWTRRDELSLPIGLIYDRLNFGNFSEATADMATADFDGDDREDILICRQENVCEVWGFGQLDASIERIRRFEGRYRNAQNPRMTLAAPVNFVSDGPVLAYSEGEYRLVYTEPMPLAALAAPPSIAGVNPGGQTSFGNTTSTSTTTERSLSVRASATVGVKVDGGALTQSEFELKQTATVSAKLVTSRAYDLSKTVIFTSGQDEDTVVFTTIPVDQYTYTVLSHPDPNMVGQEVVVSLPREPVTIQAERSFYNNAVQNPADRIGDEVFEHRIGDVDTYPSLSRKNFLLSQNGGLQSSLQGVGQGGQGAGTTVQITVGNSIGVGGSLAVDFERSIQATAGGALGGVSVGVTAEAGINVSSGMETTYTGTVAPPVGGNADYLWGMFTYVRREPNREFQVINYWVE
jgi:hypothetical protein